MSKQEIQQESCSCLRCGVVMELEESVPMREDTLCVDCADEHTTLCHRCGVRIWCSYDNGDDHISLCQSCREDYYVGCENCGALLQNEDAFYEDEDDDQERPYCEDCFQELEKSPIHSYGYKPLPIFYGEGNRYFGVELEVDGGGKDKGHAQAILDILNRKEVLGYIKADGSLLDGLELVLHPMTLGFASNQVPWKEILSKFLTLGYYSHLTETCGLHIHVNRASLGKGEEEQDAAIANILYFFERFWEEMLRFSRRTENQVRKWAARYGYKQSGQEILEHAKQCHAGRYTCVNLTNYHTIEFRMFRGTLKLNTIQATLQLIDEVCHVARSFSAQKLQSMSWTDFMLNLDLNRTPQLIQYLKERRLYVNEPVQVEQEEA